MNDTPKNIEDFYFRKFASLTGAEKIKMASDSFESAKTMVLASLKHGLSQPEKKMELLLRFYGEDLNEQQIEDFRKLNGAPGKGVS